MRTVKSCAEVVLPGPPGNRLSPVKSRVVVRSAAVLSASATEPGV